ncbi:MAG: DUF2693 domain-containing protein [Bacteroidaceae bacterium]|nr:DUF2693 domain-containing protein [Bacteroidaceae bacterium]
MSAICNPDLDTLRQHMRCSEVRFLYLKLDGSVREARGTLDASRIPADKLPRGKRQPSANVLTYFDTGRNEWRCFRRERIIGLIPG